MTRLTGDRGQIQLALAAGAGALLLLLVLLLAAATGMISQQAAACTTQPPPSAQASATIPARYLALYRQAERAYGIPWTVLAGIGEVESDHGRATAPGVHSGANSAGAAGPMQFGTGGTAGNTWGGALIHPATVHTGGYGIDGDHDGRVDVYDPGDAIPSAANFLQAHGGISDIQGAIFSYNHSAQYVTDVLGWAARYTHGGAQAVAAATRGACAPGTGGPLPPGVAGKVIGYARQQIGKPYLWGATGPDAFDCSGLAMMAYRAAGIAIPRTSQLQWAFGEQIPPGQVRPGDLVFFAGADGTMTSPGHVGIVVGTGLMIDAPTAGMDVQVQRITGQPGLVGYTDPAAADSGGG
jgi:cell wall-associated NlpC family hydrolase